jgi:ATP synthase protein I
MKPDDTKNRQRLGRRVGESERRKIKTLRQKKRSAWFGFGLFGLIGWSVAVPTLLGIALGLWLDKRFPGRISWTLTFLVTGLFAGCAIAWQWVAKEDNLMHKNDE